MILDDKLFGYYLKKEKKEDIVKLIKDYNNLACIYNGEEIKNLKAKKEDLLAAFKVDEYVKYIIKSLDLKDFNDLNTLLFKKHDVNYINTNKDLINYLIDKKILIKGNDIRICPDIKELIKENLSNRNIREYVKKWDRIYKLVDGIIIAYGVVSKKYLNIIISGIEEHDIIILKMENYYKKKYKVLANYLVTTKLTNKKRINNYLKNKEYKMFKNSEYVEMSQEKYHHHMKSFKKLIKVLKNNYVFRNRDIKYIDEHIIIPYLYNSLNEEDIASEELEKIIKELFEFNNDSLKVKMIEEIKKIREDFPLWEYRGFSKNEVEHE